MGVAHTGRLFSQKVEIVDILGPVSLPHCGDWGEILHSQADPRARRPCKVWPESVNRDAPVGRKTWFLAWVNLIPAVCRFAAILRVITIMCSVSHKLCVRLFTLCKISTQFCESCGATYRRICKMFRALQSTSGPVTDVVNSVQIDAQLATLSFL